MAFHQENENRTSDCSSWLVGVSRKTAEVTIRFTLRVVRECDLDGQIVIDLPLDSECSEPAAAPLKDGKMDGNFPFGIFEDFWDSLWGIL